MQNDWNGPQPAPLALWQMVHANFPETRFLGIYNKRNVAGTNTPSAHAEGRALDIGLRVQTPREKTIGDGLYEALCDLGAAIDLDHLIWNRQIWSQERGGPRPYTGQDPHTDHIHAAFTQAGSQRTDFGALAIKIAGLRTDVETLRRNEGTIA